MYDIKIIERLKNLNLRSSCKCTNNLKHMIEAIDFSKMFYQLCLHESK